MVEDHGRVVDYVLKTVLNGRGCMTRPCWCSPDRRGEIRVRVSVGLPALCFTDSSLLLHHEDISRDGSYHVIYPLRNHLTLLIE